MSAWEFEVISSQNQVGDNSEAALHLADISLSPNYLAQRVRQQLSLYVRVVEIGKQYTGDSDLMFTTCQQASADHRKSLQELLAIGRKLHKGPAAWKQWLNHQCLMGEKFADQLLKLKTST